MFLSIFTCIVLLVLQILGVCVKSRLKYILHLTIYTFVILKKLKVLMSLF